MQAEVVEELIEEEYRAIALTPVLRESVESLILEDFDTLQAASVGERKTLEQQRIELTAQRQKLLDAHYAGAIPIDLLTTASAASSIASRTSSPRRMPTSRRRASCWLTRST